MLRELGGIYDSLIEFFVTCTVLRGLGGIYDRLSERFDTPYS